jgi:hypothetical protein
MTLDEARKRLIEGLNYAAYHETDFSLYDSDKNVLYGSNYYNSGRTFATPSPWPGEKFEKKMATLLGWAVTLNRGDSNFTEALRLLESEDSTLGRIIRLPRTPGWKPLDYNELTPNR